MNFKKLLMISAFSLQVSFVASASELNSESYSCKLDPSKSNIITCNTNNEIICHESRKQIICPDPNILSPKNIEDLIIFRVNSCSFSIFTMWDSDPSEKIIRVNLQTSEDWASVEGKMYSEAETKALEICNEKIAWERLSQVGILAFMGGAFAVANHFQ